MSLNRGTSNCRNERPTLVSTLRSLAGALKRQPAAAAAMPETRPVKNERRSERPPERRSAQRGWRGLAAAEDSTVIDLSVETASRFRAISTRLAEEVGSA